MHAKVMWLAYLLVFFALLPALFAWRYAKWPIVMRTPPADRNGWVELIYGVCVALAIVLLVALPVAPLHLGADAIVFALGVLLVLWAMLDMGPNWRIGQDAGDTTTRRVRTPLFRALRHPIYVGLVILAIGLVLMGGANPGALVLLVSTLAYVVVQGRAESVYWNARTGADAQ